MCKVQLNHSKFEINYMLIKKNVRKDDKVSKVMHTG